VRFGAENNTPGFTGGGTTFSPFWDRAFLEFAGFTVGRARSFFDIFTYWGIYTYTNVRVDADTDISGQNLWAYTAHLGNGFSASLSLEDPATHKAFTFDATAPGFFGLNGSVINDNAFAINTGNFGFRVPDIIANLRVDQAWGYAGVSVALHDASGAYYGTPNSTVNGHPADTYGWAIAAGAKFNLPGGDAIGFNVAYGDRRDRLRREQHRQHPDVQFQYQRGGRLAVRRGLHHQHRDRADARLGLHRRLRACLEPALANIVVRRLRRHRLQRHRHRHHQFRAGGRLGLRTPVRGARRQPLGGHGARRQQLQSRLQLLPGRLAHAVEPGPAPRYWSGHYLHRPQHRLQRRVYAANASRPAVTVFDDQGVWSAMVRWQRNFYR
jgi:Porin subfamily